MKHLYAKRGKAHAKRALALVPFLLASAAGCGSDEPASGYYLRGRVFNGASLEAVDAAELTLISGQETLHAKSDKDGTYRIGPIEPSASYRLDASATGMEAFEFTGVALPKLDDGINDRTLIGDVALYQKSKKSPAFKVSVQSSDPRIPVTLAALDFIPTAVGTDPSKPAEDPTLAPANLVVGAFAEPRGATLRNDAHRDALALHTTISAGSVDIPEDSLSWGSTYLVRIDAGPDFSALQFMLTPVKENDIQVVIPTTAKYPTQLPQQTQQYFTGRIYDGVTLDRMTNYTMRLEYFDRVMNATVDAEGRFVVGPLLSNADYTIVVKADGYRDFLSHNAKIATSVTSMVSSLYYDAFIYPDGVKAPPVEARFSLDGDTKLPSGTVRFAPLGSSSLFNEDAETPAGVGRQVWTNDEDLQQRAVVHEFKDGKLEMTDGEFVLGVSYSVTVYGVEGYAILTGGTFQAGIDTNPSFTLKPVTETPLSVVAMSTEGAALSPTGSVEIRFNHGIQLYPRMDQMAAMRLLNDGFAIVSPDKDADGTQNELVDSGSISGMVPPNYRGVTWEIVGGDTLKLSFNREQALSVSDTGDPITRVTYGGLSAIQLYTGTSPTSPSFTLASLVGMGQIDVQMVAQ